MHPADIFVCVNISDIDMVLHSRNPGLRFVGGFRLGVSAVWHLFGLLSDLPVFPDTGDPTSLVRMP